MISDLEIFANLDHQLAPAPPDASDTPNFQPAPERSILTDNAAVSAAVEELAADFSRGLLEAGALRRLRVPPRARLLGDWLCEGDLGFIFAARGVGKTWFSLLVAKAIAGGDPAGPWRAERSQPVLYVDGEMPLELLRAREAGLSPDADGLPLTYLNHQSLFERAGRVLNLTDPVSQDALATLCVGLGCKLLVLDNLSCLFRGVAENEADEWEKVLPWLLDLRRRGVAVIIVAHAGRNNAMRGTSRREDHAGWVIRLDDASDTSGERHGAKFTSTFTKPSRNTPASPSPLEWTVTTDAAGRCAVAYQAADGDEAVIGWVSNGLSTCGEIAREMGVSPGTVSKMATRLMAAGRLRRDGRGYALTLGSEGNEA